MTEDEATASTADSEKKVTKPGDSEEEIPKLPRAPLLGKPSLNGVVRAGMFATLLYAIIVMRRPCAEGVGRFIGGFDEAPDAGPSSITDHYPGYELMTAEEALKRWPESQTRDGGVSEGPGVGQPAGGSAGDDDAPSDDAP